MKHGLMNMQLNLGCGHDYRAGWVNVDSSQDVRADVYHDLAVKPWPFDDGAATVIRAIAILEHMPDTVAFIDECWRILEPDGLLVVRVPHWQHKTAWIDPTHKRAFHEETFDYFDPSKERGRRYSMYTPHKWQVDAQRVGGNIQAEMRKIDV